MKKIPTMFVRSADRRTVIDQITPGCEWVAAGEGRATRKWDGTCVMFDNEGAWWTRREVKPDQTPPSNWVQVDHDTETGKRVGWEPAEVSGFAKYLREAISHERSWRPGTYELIGPKINGNPEQLEWHALFPHGEAILRPRGRSYDDLAKFFVILPRIEGIVFWHDDGRMAKIKARDFGLARG